MPKQGWNVGDRKTLRRMVGTTQEFNRSGYDRITYGAPTHHDDVGVNHDIIGTTAAPVGFPQNQDKYAYGFAHPPAHWATGRVVVHAFFSSNVTSGVGEVTLRIDGMNEGSVVGAAGDILYADTSKVFTPGSSNHELIEIIWNIDEIQTADYHLWSWRIGRLGSSGTDTINTDIYYYMMDIEWSPKVETA